MHDITIQHITVEKAPSAEELQKWSLAAIQSSVASAEITIRIVDVEEMTELNSTYRKKNDPTNVLSFPLDISADQLMGDIIICANVVAREADEQNKTFLSHWAHMVVHGTLHLQGYDHIQEKDALIMEALEINILEKLGFPNPYE